MPHYSGEPIRRGPVVIRGTELPSFAPARAAADVDLSGWFERAETSDDIIYFAVVAAEDETPIGEVMLHDIDREAGSAFLHAHLFQAQRRLHGHGAHALKAAVEYAFKQEKLRSLTLNIDKENFPARRCYAKCGFQQVDRAEGDRSLLIMCLTREEWKRMVEDGEW